MIKQTSATPATSAQGPRAALWPCPDSRHLSIKADSNRGAAIAPRTTISSAKPIEKKKKRGQRLWPSANIKPPASSAGKTRADAARASRLSKLNHPTPTVATPQRTIAIPEKPIRKLPRLSAINHQGFVHSDGAETSRKPLRKNSGKARACNINVRLAHNNHATISRQFSLAIIARGSDSFSAGLISAVSESRTCEATTKAIVKCSHAPSATAAA